MVLLTMDIVTKFNVITVTSVHMACCTILGQLGLVLTAGSRALLLAFFFPPIRLRISLTTGGWVCGGLFITASWFLECLIDSSTDTDYSVVPVLFITRAYLIIFL